MPTTTPLQALRIPVGTDDPDVVDDITLLANAIEKRLVGVYNSVADRDSKITAPEKGQMAIHRDTNTIWVFFTAWTQIYPVTGQPVMHHGTAIPSNTLGANGDVYFKV